jgi:hypothetical protein
MLQAEQNWGRVTGGGIDTSTLLPSSDPIRERVATFEEQSIAHLEGTQAGHHSSSFWYPSFKTGSPPGSFSDFSASSPKTTAD